MIVGQKIKLFREKKGFSQQELAEMAGVSARTIQRIEKGESEPHGFTLRSICEALGFPPEDLFDEHLVENKGPIQALHLLPLINFFIPLLGSIIVVVIYWIANKNKYKKFDVQAKNLLFWQITFVSIVSLVFMSSVLSKLSHRGIGFLGSEEAMVLSIILMTVFFGIIPIIVSILIKLKGIKNYYPPVFKK